MSSGTPWSPSGELAKEVMAKEVIGTPGCSAILPNCAEIRRQPASGLHNWACDRQQDENFTTEAFAWLLDYLVCKEQDVAVHGLQILERAMTVKDCETRMFIRKEGTLIRNLILIFFSGLKLAPLSESKLTSTSIGISLGGIANPSEMTSRRP